MKYKEKGITLIALVVTIIVLILLAGVSIAMIVGENGILTNAKEAREKNVHATVNEKLQLEYTDYITQKKIEGRKENLISYLKIKGIIEETDEEGKYLINVEKLTGTKQIYGNGADGKNDVYMLEEVEGESLGKVATTKGIKIASTTAGLKEYKIVYYRENNRGSYEIGRLIDNTANILTLTIKENAYYHDLEDITIQYEEGMTWREWVESSYNTNFLAISDGNYSAYGRDEVCISYAFCVEIGKGSLIFRKQNNQDEFYGTVFADEIIDSNLMYCYEYPM